MLQPNMVRILATAMVGVVCGMASPLLAQDDPFAAAAPAEPASPFGGAAPAAEAASPFGGAAPPAEADDPFAGAPAAPATSFQPTFGGPAAPPAAPAAPVDAGAAPFAPAPAPAAPAAGGDPFGAVTAPEAAPISSPFGGPSAPVNVDSVAGGPAPFGSEGATPAATNTGKGIAQLFEFRYIPSATFNGKTVVTRKQLTKEEAAAFDAAVIADFGKLATDGKLPNKAYNNTNTPQEWGQWLLYAHQLDNWAIYCRDVALAGSGNETDPEKDIHWPGDPKADEQGQGGGGQELGLEGGGKGGGTRPPRPTNIYNENRSLDDQVTDFFSVPDTRQGSQGKQVIDPKQMDDQSKKLYDAFLKDLRDLEKKQTAFVKKLQYDIAQRQRDREGYQEWRDNQKRIVMDYVEEWNRRYEGRIVTVAGVRYEMYKPGTEPTNATRFANIVVTDYDLTPYDLLNEDGTLRGPAR